MRNFVCFLISIYSFIPLSALGQISDDSLINLIKESYMHEVQKPENAIFLDQIRNNTNDSTKDNFGVDIEELFRGYFSNIKLFKANYKLLHRKWIVDDFPGYFRFYVYDCNSGFPVQIKDRSEFNSFISASKFKISNLDQCYLYLLMVSKEIRGINSPVEYKKNISTNSVFLINGVGLVGSDGGLVSPEPKVSCVTLNKDLKSSDMNNIYVYVNYFQSRSIIITKRYCFIFSKKDGLKDVSVTNF